MKQSCNSFSVSRDCGLAVSRLHPWLAATPDGFVNDPNAIPQNGLVEYKNPHTCRNSLIEEAITSKQIKFLTINNGTITLKRSHHFHYQVQTAMLCTNTKWCDFVFRTNVDFLVVERIIFNEEFCDSFIPKVRAFYFNCILPELTKKRSPIRELEWISNKAEWDK